MFMGLSASVGGHTCGAQDELRCQSLFSTVFKEGPLLFESNFLGVSCRYNPSQHRRAGIELHTCQDIE